MNIRPFFPVCFALFFVVIFLFLVPVFINAAGCANQVGDVCILESVPNLTENTRDLQGYLQNIFNFGVGLAAAIAVVQIVFGGFMYMTSNVPGVKGDGLKKVYGSLIGLILIGVSYLILQQINPNILNFDIITTIQKAVEEARGIGGGDEGGSTTPGGGGVNETTARNILLSSGVGINIPPCTTGQTSGCTNVADLTYGALSALGNLKQTLSDMPGFRSCTTTNQNNCTLVITGGTEGGHATHGDGNTVDLRLNSLLDSYINSQHSSCEVVGSYPLYQVGGSQYWREGNHWHTCLNHACSFKPGTQRGGSC